MAENPCGICGVRVLDSDDAILCDGTCALWHHRECLGMTLDTYLTWSKDYEDWVCRKCVVNKHEPKKESEEARRLRSREVNMRKTPKVEYKKLDFMTDSQKCTFCNTSNRDEIKYGPIYSYKSIITHYYCLLLSSNMEQNGRDSDGILGFLAGDIAKEAKRGSKLYCSYCRANGATLGCAVAKCKVVFHLPCGLKHGTLHQFFGEFKSFCTKHRPVQKISEKILAESSKGAAMCGICYEKVVPRPVHDTLWAPCCKKNGFFHRDCVQKLAISAGYFFKCPLCNNVEAFQKAMKEFGIYIPEQDASWERVPQAYQDLLQRHDTCDSEGCKCPSGRKTNVSGTRWELILCKFCGSQGVHIGCGRLKWKCPEFECQTCTEAAPDLEEDNRGYVGDRHRLTGTGRTDNLPLANRVRERSSSVSSEDSYTVEISNQSRRVVSPPPEHRPNTPPTHHNKSNHNRNETKSFADATVLDEKTRSIVIDDSDEDVEVVSETNSGCLKAKDGSMIKVVPLSSVQKRLRVEGDVQVMPKEFVDITNHRQSVYKKPRLPSPTITEVLYDFPTQTVVSEPCSSTTAWSLPSTSYVMIDPASLRQQDAPLNNVVYRSVQPIVNLPQAQTPMQPQHVPMQPLEGEQSSRHDAKHTDLSKHGAWSCDHLCPFHFKGSDKKASARALEHNSFGRRGRRRNSKCHYNRLNSRVKLTPLQHRVRDGHIEILCPRRNLSFSFMKRKATPLPYQPMKKVKVTKEKEKAKRGRKRKIPDVDLFIEKDEPARKKGRKVLIEKSDDDNLTTTVTTESNKPPQSVNLFTTLKLKWPKVAELTKGENTSTTIEPPKLPTEKIKKAKYVSKKKPFFEEWKCKRIDEYLTRCDKIPIIATDIKDTQECLSTDVCRGNKAKVVQTLLDEIIDDIFTHISTDENTDSFGENTSNPECIDDSVVLLDHVHDEMKNCETTANVSPSVTEFVEILDIPFTSSIITDNLESSEEHISSVKNRTDMINEPIDETVTSSSGHKTDCVTASPQKSTLVVDELRLQNSIPITDCKNMSPKVLKKDMTKKTNNLTSSYKGFFPRIKLSGHSGSENSYYNHQSKHSKRSRKTAYDVNELYNKQENQPKRSYRKFNTLNLSKKNRIRVDNKVSMIDHYFSHLKKDTDFKSSLDTQTHEVDSCLNSSGEDNKNYLNSDSPTSPEKKPLVELQYKMLPFFSC